MAMRNPTLLAGSVLEHFTINLHEEVGRLVERLRNLEKATKAINKREEDKDDRITNLEFYVRVLGNLAMVPAVTDEVYSTSFFIIIDPTQFMADLSEELTAAQLHRQWPQARLVKLVRDVHPEPGFAVDVTLVLFSENVSVLDAARYFDYDGCLCQADKDFFKRRVFGACNLPEGRAAFVDTVSNVIRSDSYHGGYYSASTAFRENLVGLYDSVQNWLSPSGSDDDGEDTA